MIVEHVGVLLRHRVSAWDKVITVIAHQDLAAGIVLLGLRDKLVNHILTHWLGRVTRVQVLVRQVGPAALFGRLGRRLNMGLVPTVSFSSPTAMSMRVF